MNHKHEWRDTTVTWPKGSRPGLFCPDCRSIAVAPKDERKHKSWKEKMTR